MLWQLKKLSTGETLNQPQKLPVNWGPIFGMAGIQDRLGDLSWLGEAYSDQGWVVVGEAPPDSPQSTEAVIAWEKAKKYLQDSDWSMLPDISMLSNKKLEWIEYRRALREIRLQPDFPTSINWPVKPE
jgi:hypothetical protein